MPHVAIAGLSRGGRGVIEDYAGGEAERMPGQAHARCCTAHAILLQCSDFVTIRDWTFGAARRILALLQSRNDAQGAKPMTVLPNLAAELEAAKARNAQLEALLAAANKPKALTLKVSEKGAVSIYGLGRFPITLYAGQMDRLLAHADTIRTFMKANQALLATKD